MGHIHSKYQEKIIAELKQGDVTFLLLMNKSTGSWSVIAINSTSPGIACLAASGDRALLKLDDDI